MFDPAAHAPAGLFGLRPHHIGYVVEDLEAAVDHWARALRTGPWFLYHDVVVEGAMHDGRPSTYELSAAFASHGDIFIELQQFKTLAPAPVADMLWPSKGTYVNLVAYVSPTVREDSARLEAIGMPLVVHIENDDLDEYMHASPLGHAIVLHAPTPFIERTFGEHARAAHAWDGRSPVHVVAAS